MEKQLKHLDVYQRLDRQALSHDSFHREFCLGLWHRVWFIGIVIEPIAGLRGAVIIASSDVNILKVGSFLTEKSLGKAAPLVKKRFSSIPAEKQTFFSDRPGITGVPYRRCKGQGLGLVAHELDTPLPTPSLKVFAEEEWVYVPVKL